MTRELFFEKWGPSDSKDWDAFKEDLASLVGVEQEYCITGWISASGSFIIDVKRRLASGAYDWRFVAREPMPNKDYAQQWASAAYPTAPPIVWMDDHAGAAS